MRKRPFNYVRAYRLRWGLTSKELAKLVGRDPTMLSRLEARGRAPSFPVTLALEVVFGVSARQLFPARYERVEEAIMQRAARLHESLEGKTDQRSEKLRGLLADMLRRATDSEWRT